ncbi:MAG TPA: Crp/Fnr family transcriptional regulator [Spirochaetota bacterium]
MKAEEILLKTDIFRDASPSLIQVIAKAGKVITFKKGDILFNEGDEGSVFYIVMNGVVRLAKNTLDGKEILVRLVNQFETFGEVIIFESREYPVTSVAVEETTLFTIQRQSILDNLGKEEFRTEFCAMLMRRLRYLTERILYVSAYDVEERFFRFLLEQYGKKYSYEITMPKKEIASAIGTIPETMSRLLQRLKNRKLIQWDENTLTIQKGFWDTVQY